jgi:two-component system OmpR family response regulator
VNVLIVEDDESVARFLNQAFTEAGYAPRLADDGVVALEIATTTPFDLILLDVMLPGVDGFEVCRRLRAARVKTPILIITARDALDEKIRGLDSGADDYVVKPFQVAELLARARALLRRGTSSPGVLGAGDVSLDPAARRVTVLGVTVPLSATEYSLLEYLLRNTGRVLTRSMILEHVWQYDFDGRDNVLDVYVSYLRKKLDRGRSPSLIQTVRGVGYTIDARDDNGAA